MTMLGYFDVFPDKTRTELRTAIFDEVDADDLLPAGTFVFTEYFCTDLNCDCRRVLVKVLHVQSQDARPDEVATISYGWDPHSGGLWKLLNSDMPNPFLDPFHQQASYADELLDFWSTMIENDSVYASRIQRHYEEIRAEVGQTTETSDRRYRTDHESRKRPRRALTKSERKARKRRLARKLK